MEIQLKQRLVGLTVIFSLAVIFLPMLLDGSGRSPRHLKITIPPAPQIESNIRVEEKVIELKKETASLRELKPLIVDELSDPPESEDLASESQDNSDVPQQAVISKDSKAAETPHDKQNIEVKTIDVKPVKKVVTQAGKNKPQIGGDLWVIQTGSFRDKDKAYRERDRIRKSKLSAVFIEKFELNGSLNYRVRMGPFLTRKKADIVRNKVLAKYNVKGIVMSYEK